MTNSDLLLLLNQQLHLNYAHSKVSLFRGLFKHCFFKKTAVKNGYLDDKKIKIGTISNGMRLRRKGGGD
jgi:hypothetical protein